MARFNAPPGWPTPPAGWLPEPGWKPDPHWPPAPAGWRFWIDDQSAAPDPAGGFAFGTAMRGKWGWAAAAVVGVVLLSVIAAPRGTDPVAAPPAVPRLQTSPSPARSASTSSPTNQDKAAAEARARATAQAKAAQRAAATQRAWAALSRAEGSAARFEHFHVSVITFRRISAETQVLARVCVRKLPDPAESRTRISWDPWSITAGSRDLRPQSPSADLDHAFPAEATYRIGQCALGWLVFPTDQPVRLITYANGVGEEAIWDGADVTASPETNVTPPEPAPEEQPEPLDEPATDYDNCKELNGDYPHGVGRPNAEDKTRNDSPPVTNFEESQSLYDANRESDRDKDGVACEKQ